MQPDLLLGNRGQITSPISSPTSSLVKGNHQQHYLQALFTKNKRDNAHKTFSTVSAQWKPTRNAGYHHYLALTLLSLLQAALHIHTCFHGIPTIMAQSRTLVQRFVLHKPPLHTASSFKLINSPRTSRLTHFAAKETEAPGGSHSVLPSLNQLQIPSTRPPLPGPLFPEPCSARH